MLWLCVLLFFILFAGIAMTIGEGLWTNSINLFAVMLAALAGVAFGYPLGDWAIKEFEKDGTFLWYFRFAGVWLIFFVTAMVFRLVAERASKVRMRFVPQLEMIAGPLMGLFVALFFTSVFAWTLFKLPIKSNEWKLSEASDWQKSTFVYLSTPFNSLGKAVLGDADVADGELKRK
jgi:hypothetical protein